MRDSLAVCANMDTASRDDRLSVRGIPTTRLSTTTDGGFYQISDSDIYVHSAFYDDRYRTKYIRVFGMQNRELSPKVRVRCRLQFEGNVKVDLPIETSYPVFQKWPSTKLQYHAYYYGCGVPDVFDFSKNFTFSLLVEGTDIETVVPLHMNRDRNKHIDNVVPNDSKSRRVVICVKAMWGWINATRLVEWLEFHRLLGVDKIAIYDTTILGSATRVLDYYQQIGLVDVVKFDFTLRMATLMQKDPFKSQLADDALLLEQTYLVSMNDCYYRYKDMAHYVLVIDQDEIIVPMKDTTLGEMMVEAEAEKLNASAFHFQTAWHLEDFGIGNKDAPSYMHMQRYTKRSPVMQSQPKAIINANGAIVINWHGSVTMPSSHGYQGNQYLPWQRFGYVHHFRKSCKYDASKCSVIAQMTEMDDIVPKYQNIMTTRVRTLLNKLNLDYR